MDYFQYKRWFDENRAKLKLPSDCSEIEPASFYITNQYVWTFEWHLGFPDPKYIRVWEHHMKWKGLLDSRRTQFAFHYGPVVHRDKDGVPIWQSADLVDLRIDNSEGRPHLHYGAPEPHHLEENVKGLDLEKIDMFTFIKCIFSHRKTGKPIHNLLAFRIE